MQHAKYLNRLVTAPRNFTHVRVMTKSEFVRIAKEGAKANFPLRLASERLAKLRDDHVVILMNWEALGVGPFGEALLPCGQVARRQFLLEFEDTGPEEVWLDIRPKRLASFLSMMTPIWPTRLPTRKAGRP